MIWLQAIFIGLLGSFHCVGMCGPIVLILPSGGNGKNQFQNASLYHLGRITTYGSLGLLTGVIGLSFKIAHIQQYVSIIIGAIIILLSLGLIMNKKSVFGNFLAAKFWTPVRNKLSQLLGQQNKRNFFFIGLLNGLLPCGLIYFALTSSLLSQSVLGSSLYMMAFGLGTVPALFALSYAKTGIIKRVNIKRLVPVVLFISGALLVTRGLNLGIPYLSPKTTVVKELPVLGDCCSKATETCDKN